ncbi:putative acyl esterase [Bradyrhizobium sp. USDA 4449]
MIIERNVEIVVDDGLVLYADVFRPDGADPVPVIMTLGPYGKGVRYQDHYKASWQWLTHKHPGLLDGSRRALLTWETVDPEIWVPWGYAVVRVDSRGAARTAGLLDILSPRETLDYFHAIEWAGTRSWSNGKVGLNGISYYAINQWHVAALQPPHLAALIPWEGAADSYRDFFRHGGILSNKFLETWYPRQILAVQHGNTMAPVDPWTGERSSGPVALSDRERADNRVHTLDNVRARELNDEWYASRSPDWSKVITPFLSSANWAGFGLHPRGNFEAFVNAAAKQKWLEVHPGRHEEWFYLPYGMELQKRFLDYYLKGIDNGWEQESRVLLNIRRPFCRDVELRKENDWPLARTQWRSIFLEAASATLHWEVPHAAGSNSFDALGDGIRFISAPLTESTEITGPLALKLFISSSTVDADLFVTMIAYSPDGREVEFEGTVDPHTPLAQGWLRASHRKLCPQRSLPHRPFHTHDEKQPLVPNEVYELDIEIWPTCIVLPAGYRLALDLRGVDFARAVDPASSLPYRGSGPWLHDDPVDRAATIFGGTTSIYSGPSRPSHLLLPMIPAPPD